jgi:hypothetical protein
VARLTHVARLFVVGSGAPVNRLSPVPGFGGVDFLAMIDAGAVCASPDAHCRGEAPAAAIHAAHAPGDLGRMRPAAVAVAQLVDREGDGAVAAIAADADLVGQGLELSEHCHRARRPLPWSGFAVVGLCRNRGRCPPARILGEVACALINLAQDESEGMQPQGVIGADGRRAAPLTS